MNINVLSPYVRTAMYSTFDAPFKIKQRVIFDFELIFVADGYGALMVDGEKYICKKDDVILLKPGVRHSIETVGEYSFSQPHIHFDAVYDVKSPHVFVSFLDKEQMSNQELAMIREDFLSPLPSPFLKAGNLDEFKRMFYGVIDCFEKKGTLYRLECKQRMLELLLHLFKENGVVADDEELRTDVISLIKDFIDQNYCNRISLNSLEKQFHYSKFYIDSCFSKRYNCPVIKYYHSLRIDEAKSDLEKGKSVGEIAQKLNMSSIYAFSRFFKAKTGESPTEYKNNLTGKY